ncbi:fructose-2,6-bisphosphatase [Terriglobus roseus DSM 18391]|uniref:Fructose-2,6-bisphosphatase n=1 Tax=Terriglobus roseus (strain DSM 18391 / NRRL B-41598 / KBS 63) TaxID=926566 RepID=I3ZM04_TERRK|nr:histidine phosphatase family protein [Terriglobus roseus]AFL90272.1 fructose-2,6-bisphosphatase [Terriglobus roseus DSM 18391]
MSERTPELWLIRHGETEWSKSGQHTSFTDLPLTPFGVEQAKRLQPVLGKVDFDLVLTSPRQRATVTAELAGVHHRAEIDEDLQEWNYGIHEGVTTAQVRETDPTWNVWRSENPGGETLAQVEARTERVIERCMDNGGRCALIAHAHVFRVLAGMFLIKEGVFGEHLLLSTASISVLGVDRGVRVIKRWNEMPPE